MPRPRLVGTRCGWALLCLLAAWSAGCNESKAPRGATGDLALSADTTWKQDLFDTAIDNLSNLEQFNAREMLSRVVEHLNQSADWQRAVTWQADPLLASLSKEDRSLAMLENLDAQRFQPYDGYHLQESVAMRDVARQVVGARTEALPVAEALFDWTIRNIGLAKPGELGVDAENHPLVPRHLPYQTLYFGRGEAIDRAWVFVLLARQQGLDAAVLAIPGSAPPSDQLMHDDSLEGQRLHAWCVGVLAEGKVLLFDPLWGLPIPGPAGQGVATLDQVAENDALLRALDLDENQRYPVAAEDLKQVVALVEASPGYLSRRMKVVESRLAGKRSMVLATEPSATAERFRQAAGIKDARLWQLPFERLRAQQTPAGRAAAERELRPFRFDQLPEEFQPVVAALQRGRVLQLKGIFLAEPGEPSANQSLQKARLSDKEIAEAKLEPEQKTILEEAKENASFWLGLIAYERERYENAAEHFSKRTIEAYGDQGHWHDAACYNLGRADEALGRTDKAIADYEADQSLGRRGSLLRARRLKTPQAAP